MSSNVNVAFPPDNEKVSKADMRDQFQTIKTEIEALQRVSTLPWKLALSEFDSSL